MISAITRHVVFFIYPQFTLIDLSGPLEAFGLATMMVPGSYRINYRGRAVVLSGDTRFSQNVVKFATGADLLIHEVGMARPEVVLSELAKRILSVHTSPQEAGRVFSSAKPRLAVYTHIGAVGGAGQTAPQPADFIAATRETYSGPLEFGEDLMTINIGDTVGVERSAKN